MSYRGYSNKLIEANRAADTSKVGVQLGRHCIQKDITVSEVAELFGVSRQSVYYWFTGQVEPHPDMQLKIKKYMQGQHD